MRCDSSCQDQYVELSELTNREIDKLLGLLLARSLSDLVQDFFVPEPPVALGDKLL